MGNWCSSNNRIDDIPIEYQNGESDLINFENFNAREEKLIDHLLGCAYGQALGDAYGLSTEFESRKNVVYNYPDSSQLIPFPNYVLTKHSERWRQGDWTDDTDQWILILETLMTKDGDERLFAEKLKNWIQNGFSELGDSGGVGIGTNVLQVVYSKGFLKNPFEISQKVWERGHCKAAPNGAVMRCSASAFIYYNDIEKMKDITIRMCKTTHFDPRCIASCLAVCLAISYVFSRKDSNIETLIERVQNETIQTLGQSLSSTDAELFLWHTDKERTLEDLNLDEPQKIGFTYKCLASGFYGLRSTRPFANTLNDLIRCGGDADTNGAVCGTMYGARHGYKALPQEWLRKMPYKKWFDQKIIKCLEQMNLIRRVISV